MAKLKPRHRRPRHSGSRPPRDGKRSRIRRPLLIMTAAAVVSLAAGLAFAGSPTQLPDWDHLLVWVGEATDTVQSVAGAAFRFARDAEFWSI